MLSLNIEKQPELLKLIQQGQEIVLLLHDNPIAKITPLSSAPKRKLGSATGLFKLSEDFDASLADFADYQ
jgi:antitoxin (DNA-binding transcriptional repressor) of toxin-antitoxin stability system